MAEEKKKPIDAFDLIRNQQDVRLHADAESEKHWWKVYREGVRDLISEGVTEPGDLGPLIMELWGDREIPGSSAGRLLPIVLAYQEELIKPIADEFYTKLVGNHGFEMANPKDLEGLFGIKPTNDFGITPDGAVNSGVYVSVCRDVGGPQIWALLSLNPDEIGDYVSRIFFQRKEVPGKRFFATLGKPIGADNIDARVKQAVEWGEEGARILGEYK